MTKQIPAHADLIKLWAEGAVIQYLVPYEKDPVWRDCHNNLPTWTPKFNYRIKPEPKPDVVSYWQFNPCMHKRCAESWIADANLKLTFDGETGQLKSAEVL